jgi:hypothetical protein
MVAGLTSTVVRWEIAMDIGGILGDLGEMMLILECCSRTIAFEELWLKAASALCCIALRTEGYFVLFIISMLVIKKPVLQIIRPTLLL